MVDVHQDAHTGGYDPGNRRSSYSPNGCSDRGRYDGMSDRSHSYMLPAGILKSQFYGYVGT